VNGSQWQSRLVPWCGTVETQAGRRARPRSERQAAEHIWAVHGGAGDSPAERLELQHRAAVRRLLRAGILVLRCKHPEAGIMIRAAGGRCDDLDWRSPARAEHGSNRAGVVRDRERIRLCNLAQIIRLFRLI
jgi:hypothetical protein